MIDSDWIRQINGKKKLILTDYCLLMMIRVVLFMNDLDDQSTIITIEPVT